MIDRDALAANYRLLAARAPAAQTGAAVKADAYGLGAAAVSRRLMREGCRIYFTATAAEGAVVRGALGDGEAEIFVLHGYWPHEHELVREARLTPVINTPEQAAALKAAGLPCALHVDTGMNRLGMDPQDAAALFAEPGLAEALDLRLVMSHLACADEPDHPMNAAQREAFASLAQRLPGVRASLANTAGVMLDERYAFDVTRPGAGLYGTDPSGLNRFRPVAHIEAPVLQVRTLKPGDPVGYGATFRADRETKAATVALGYADGYMRSGGGGGFARVDGERAAILGRVSMDLIVIDVTGLEDRIEAGAPATFLGADLDATAALAGSTGYELLTRLGPRFQRVYEGAA